MNICSPYSDFVFMQTTNFVQHLHPLLVKCNLSTIIICIRCVCAICATFNLCPPGCHLIWYWPFSYFPPFWLNATHQPPLNASGIYKYKGFAIFMKKWKTNNLIGIGQRKQELFTTWFSSPSLDLCSKHINYKSNDILQHEIYRAILTSFTANFTITANHKFPENRSNVEFRIFSRENWNDPHFFATLQRTGSHKKCTSQNQNETNETLGFPFGRKVHLVWTGAVNCNNHPIQNLLSFKTSKLYFIWDEISCEEKLLLETFLRSSPSFCPNNFSSLGQNTSNQDFN